MVSASTSVRVAPDLAELAGLEARLDAPWCVQLRGSLVQGERFLDALPAAVEVLDELAARHEVEADVTQLARGDQVVLGRQCTADVLGDKVQRPQHQGVLAVLTGKVGGVQVGDLLERVRALVWIKLAPGGDKQVDTGGHHGVSLGRVTAASGRAICWAAEARGARVASGTPRGSRPG